MKDVYKKSVITLGRGDPSSWVPAKINTCCTTDPPGGSRGTIQRAALSPRYDNHFIYQQGSGAFLFRSNTISQSHFVPDTTARYLHLDTLWDIFPGCSLVCRAPIDPAINASDTWVHGGICRSQRAYILSGGVLMVCCVYITWQSSRTICIIDQGGTFKKWLILRGIIPTEGLTLAVVEGLCMDVYWSPCWASLYRYLDM